MTEPAPATDLEVRANALYWESDRAVNQIAEELDLSKGTLYGLIQPLAAALACPECGAEVQYMNRTAHERGRVTCPSCGYQGLDQELADSGIGASAEGPLSRAIASRKTLWGAALLGVAAGLVIAGWHRRR